MGRDSILRCLPHVFERRVKGRESNGHGLGLAFVDAVARAHGGTVTASNRENGGAHIAIGLPLASRSRLPGRGRHRLPTSSGRGAVTDQAIARDLLAALCVLQGIGDRSDRSEPDPCHSSGLAGPRAVSPRLADCDDCVACRGLQPRSCSVPGPFRAERFYLAAIAYGDSDGRILRGTGFARLSIKARFRMRTECRL